MLFLIAEIILIGSCRKYGLIALDGATWNFLTYQFDPIWREPPILIKLRDPRKKIRSQCLVRILDSWELIEPELNAYKTYFYKRIGYCLVDREKEIRELACAILKQRFQKTIADFSDVLLSCLHSNFYLIDKGLKQKFNEQGFNALELCARNA